MSLWMKVAGSGALLVGLAVGCSSTPAATPRLCTPGANVFCRCVDRKEGTKLCNEKGDGFGECRLGSNQPCPEEPPPPDTPPPNKEEVAAACDGYTRALCSNLNRCAPYILSTNLLDVDRCVTRMRTLCVGKFTGEGARATPQDLQTCASEMASLGCEDVLDGVEPASCFAHPGDRANGSACSGDAQCTSFACAKTGQECGTCRPRGKENDDCTDKLCEEGLSCEDNKCVRLGRVNAPCTNSRQCAANLACDGSKCVAALTVEGATCNTSRDLCSALHGLYCSTNRCIKFGRAGLGETCGVVAGRITYCSSLASCIDDKCVDQAFDGQSCNDTTGPECQQPSSCVAGKCTPPVFSASCK